MNEDENKELITVFYTAFQNKDAATMASCYHQEAVFNDPVFSDLSHDKLVAMWAMLSERGKNLVIKFEEPELSGEKYVVKWTADYEFGKKRRKVLNKITANIICKDEKIFIHRDEFSFFKWAVQAFGPLAYLFAWIPFFRNKVRTTVMKSLNIYMKTKNQS